MFRLLSKESNIFSIPVYIAFLLMILSGFNALDISEINLFSSVISFIGISLGYFVFNQIKLTYQTHLPLFLYTFFIFAFYPGDLDIGIAVSLFINSFLLLFLTVIDEDVRKHYYVLIGVLLVINFIFLPTTWPMIFFVIFHILMASKRIISDIIKLIFGALLIGISYFGVMFCFNYNAWDGSYFPFENFSITTKYYPLYLLSPIALILILAVIDHFNSFNKKNLTSRFKYTFILIFTLAQLVSIILYMNENYEYLLLLALPISIIFSRYLKFLPEYWMREVGIWLLVFFAVLFKLGSYLDLFKI